MAIQYNDGPRVIRYLTKYLEKQNYGAKVMLKDIQLQGSVHYQKPSFVTKRDHYLV